MKREPQFDETMGKHALPKDLADALKVVGPKYYGLATARKFAPNGEYGQARTRRRRFAIT